MNGRVTIFDRLFAGGSLRWVRSASLEPGARRGTELPFEPSNVRRPGVSGGDGTPVAILRQLAADAHANALALVFGDSARLRAPADVELTLDERGETVTSESGIVGVNPRLLDGLFSGVSASPNSEHALPGRSLLVAAGSMSLLMSPGAARVDWSDALRSSTSPLASDFAAALLLDLAEDGDALVEWLFERVGARRHAAAARRAYVAELCHPSASRARAAARRAGSAVTCSWTLPELARAYAATRDEARRQMLATAHYEIGKRALTTYDERAEMPIFRSTHAGRHRKLDELLCSLLTAASRNDDGWVSLFGVDLAELRTALREAPLRIRDEAVSSGQTSIDLWRALQFENLEGEIIASDAHLRFHRVATESAAGTVGTNGRCVEVCSCSARSPLRCERSAAADARARELELAFARHDDAVRSANEFDWITPLADEARHDPRLPLRFREFDVFACDTLPAHAIRVCGLLYERLRPDADAESYFSTARIRDALRVLGRGLRPGGLLVAGSVIDSSDGQRRYTDADVFQRRDRNGRGHLVHCCRIGLGIGPAALDALTVEDEESRP